MKALVHLFSLTLLASPALIQAQSDTAHHRAVYAQINEKEKSLTKVTGTHKDEPLVFSLTGWMEGSQLRKIVAISSEDGHGIEEYYLENEQPLFVYSTYQRDALSKKPVTIENRLYFKDGHIFKWLTNDKAAGVLHGEDYAGETERLTSNCTAFVAALKNKKSGKTAATQVTEGTFVRIDEGDYLHWNMNTSSEDELSLFILKPDASVEKVMDNPQDYVGKRCRATWKTSLEDIPEAGGKIEVKQILSVEWIGKK